MRKKLLAVVLLAAFALPLTAQTSSFMDQLMASDGLTWGQAAYLVLVASDNLSEDASEQRSLDQLKQQRWANEDVQVNAPIPLSSYSYLLMRAFGVPGGAFYSLFPGPRYAFRELSFRSILSSNDDPDAILSGAQGIRILGKVMDAFAVKKESNP